MKPRHVMSINTGASLTRDPTSTNYEEGGSGASFILGRAASYAALAASTVTNVGLTVVTGDIGVYAGNQVTGFNPPGVFTGALHAGDTYAQLAQLNLLGSYNLLAGLPCNVELTDTNLGGLVLAPGVYRFASSAVMSNVALTLEGTLSPSDAWLFQVGSSLITDPLASVTLTRGARSSNFFWQVGSSATLDHDTWFVGSLLAYTSVSANDGASLDGRALAVNGAITLINNAFTFAGLPFVLAGPSAGDAQCNSVTNVTIGELTGDLSATGGDPYLLTNTVVGGECFSESELVLVALATPSLHHRSRPRPRRPSRLQTPLTLAHAVAIALAVADTTADPVADKLAIALAVGHAVAIALSNPVTIKHPLTYSVDLILADPVAVKHALALTDSVADKHALALTNAVTHTLTNTVTDQHAHTILNTVTFEHAHADNVPLHYSISHQLTIQFTLEHDYPIGLVFFLLVILALVVAVNHDHSVGFVVAVGLLVII
ncbi:ice-binding protein [Acanthamoeba castellanii str. Neff]|uniref:Ice-binding protein n=1 Tax=Acanthamoeba castellanii (strain ATCC 30010 / Neff) TaxID=1257118 RepID=L8H6H5_ACACF|nr:ice-binding protein [Acanthamoeba castellanii str. Neff]ELR20847.1 ice-binding protein [Acanthamoeba castellanii str. Neff]